VSWITRRRNQHFALRQRWYQLRHVGAPEGRKRAIFARLAGRKAWVRPS